MQVVHTAALPPNHGRIIRAMSGCTRNSRKDDRKIVAAYGISRLLDLFRERLLQHPAGDRIHGFGLLAEIAVRGERVTGTRLGRLTAGHGHEGVPAGQTCRRGVRRRLAAVFPVMHEQQPRLDGAKSKPRRDTDWRRRLAPPKSDEVSTTPAAARSRRLISAAPWAARRLAWC